MDHVIFVIFERCVAFPGGLLLEEGCQVFGLNAANPTRVKSEFARNSVPLPGISMTKFPTMTQYLDRTRADVRRAF
jgi:hypothetical protein